VSGSADSQSRNTSALNGTRMNRKFSPRSGAP
jgi:hypothetical protein